MMFKRLFSKLKKLKKISKFKKKKSKSYPNRFLKFYYLNQNRLVKERRKTYHEKKKTGVCVRCHRKALKNIVFCKYHRLKQKEYNRLARES